MAGLSSNGESTVLNALLAGRYASLHTADPGNTGASEVAGSGYARVGPVTFANAGNNPTVASNSGVVQFAVATGSWGTVTHYGLWSAASGGTFLGSGALDTAKAVAVDDVVRFPIGEMKVTAE